MCNLNTSDAESVWFIGSAVAMFIGDECMSVSGDLREYGACADCLVILILLGLY